MRSSDRDKLLIIFTQLSATLTTNLSTEILRLVLLKAYLIRASFSHTYTSITEQYNLTKGDDGLGKVTACLSKNNGSLLLGLRLCHLQADCLDRDQLQP